MKSIVACPGMVSRNVYVKFCFCFETQLVVRAAHIDAAKRPIVSPNMFFSGQKPVEASGEGIAPNPGTLEVIHAVEFLEYLWIDAV